MRMQHRIAAHFGFGGFCAPYAKASAIVDALLA